MKESLPRRLYYPGLVDETQPLSRSEIELLKTNGKGHVVRESHGAL